MNGIDRRGQKVVCVMEVEITDIKGNVYTGPRPVLDEVYTVTDFLPSLMQDQAGEPFTGDLTPGIALAEIPCIVGKIDKRPAGWPIVCFRPRLERETDISALVEAGGRSDLLTPDDRLAEFMRPFEARPTKFSPALDKACSDFANALAREFVRSQIAPWLEARLK